MRAQTDGELLARVGRGRLNALANWPRMGRLVDRGHVDRTIVQASPYRGPLRAEYEITDAGRRAMAFYRRPSGDGGTPTARASGIR